jgi:hypothetical protein
MDRGGCHSKIERACLQVGILGPRYGHSRRRKSRSELLGESLSGLNRRHVKSGRKKRTCCLSGAGAQVERTVPCLQKSALTNGFPQGSRVRRPGGRILVCQRLKMHRVSHGESIFSVHY